MRTIKVDVRLIAATNRDLEQMIESGSFRADLFYRLNVFPIEVPPLRERVPDIEPLALHFLGKIARKLGRNISGIEPRSLVQMKAYSWPGNIRELKNLIERSAILCKTPALVIRGLREPSTTRDNPVPATTSLEEMIRDHIIRALENSNWVIEGARGAASVLGLKPSTLRYKIGKLNIQRPE